jgi:hypothetical protein
MLGFGVAADPLQTGSIALLNAPGKLDSIDDTFTNGSA